MSRSTDNLQQASVDELLKLVQVRGLVPMLRHEYDRGVAEGRLVRLSELAPEVADLIAEKEREAFTRGRDATRSSMESVERRERETISEAIGNLRSEFWRLESAVSRLAERAAEEKKLEELKTRLIEIESRMTLINRADDVSKGFET